MIQGTELSPGVWALHNSESGHNSGVLFEPEGIGPLMVVDPGRLPEELDALDAFASEQGRRVDSALFTRDPGQHPALERWPHAIVITPEAWAISPLPLLAIGGWELLLLAAGRLALYSRTTRILFSGEMLRAATIPDLWAGADNYLEALERIESLDVRLLVPHSARIAQGKRDVRDRITADRDYTHNLVRHVVTSIAARLPRDRVLAVAREIYDEYAFLEQHLSNLGRVWDEFAGRPAT